MNSFDSTSECLQNISKLLDEDCNCTAIDKNTEQFCGESETLKILDEFQKLYETKIKNVDHEVGSEFDQVCMKLEISKEWIKNLKEQNIMLVQVVEDLEQAACSRVKLLEQKLRHSSGLVSENVTKSVDTGKTINALSNRISNLEKDEEYMRQKIEFLQSDIRGLLELIRRAVEENRWNSDGITFFEIEPSDIPVPNNCTCDQEETKIQTLKLQIKELQENEISLIAYQKELEGKLISADNKLQIKEDFIKKQTSQLQNFKKNLKKHAKFTDQVPHSSFNDEEAFDETGAAQNICVDVKSCNENQIISHLNKVKSFMEQEMNDISKLKREYERIVEKLCCTKDEEYHMTNNECNMDSAKHKLAKNIECINCMYSKMEELIGIINCLLEIGSNNLLRTECSNLLPCTDINQQLKLMDALTTCSIEAEVTIRNIKDEMNVLDSSFKCRHKKYVNLNKDLENVQNQLINSREKIAKAINRLQLRDEERIRYNNRITSGKNKLKDIKNEINFAHSRLSACITDLQTNENPTIYNDMCLCNDLLYSVVEEIEQTSSSLQVFQSQGYCVTEDLEKLKNQFCEVDSYIRKLQEKIDETLAEHDTIERIFPEKEQKLQKLEAEIDVIHSKIQNILELSFSSKEQTSGSNMMGTYLNTQNLNEILQIKQNVYRLRKEHDELKYKLSQKSLYPECDKKTCVWKCRVTDLQDQVKILQHEVNCNEETKNFLRSNIQSMEEELRAAQAKADNYRKSHSTDNMELKKKTIELENTLKLQKEIEYTLRRQLDDNQVELKKSKELFNCHTEHSIEETLLRCGCYQIRHDAVAAPQLLKTLQNTISSTKTGLQELKAEFKKLIYEDSSNICPSAKSIMNLLDKLEKYESELDNCFQEIEELKNTLYSKDKRIENMDEIIKIQKDSIVMMQAEVKELHQKFQEKIDNQDQIISQCEKEKKELLRQNELQIQTISHLQNAVVEAKKCIDQMGHRTVSDTNEWSSSSSSVYSQGVVHDV